MITIQTSPSSYTSAHEKNYFVCSSDNTGQANFKYVFDIYVNSIQIARLKIFPDPATAYGIVDIGQIVRNYLINYFLPPAAATGLTTAGTVMSATYELKIGEEYAATIYSNLAASGLKKVYNYYNPPLTIANTLSSYVGYWLSTRDRTKGTTTLTERFILSYFADTAVLPTNIVIQKYNADGTNDGISLSASIGVTQEFTLFNVSPTVINNMSAGFITASTYSYGVWLQKVAVVISQVFTIKLSCTRFTPIPLTFLNSLGGYDTFTFRLVNKKSKNNTSKSFGKLGWALSGTTMQRSNTYNVINSTNVPFSNNQKFTYKLQSDYINETDHNWLGELIGSPEVYLHNGTNFYPVTIKTTNWDEKIKIVDKLFMFDLEIEFAEINSQYK